MKPQFLILVLLITAVACSTATEQAKARGDCFEIVAVRGVSTLGTRHVYVESGQNGHYLLTTAPKCIGLDKATGIKISRQHDQVCSNTGDFIAYQDGTLPVRCRIQKVEKVNDLEDARRLVKELATPAAGE